MRYFIDTFFWILIASMIGISTYFTFSISKIKGGMEVSAANLKISSGQKGAVKKIIDGDEVVVEALNRKFVVRILGIASFDPSLNDPLDKSAGEAALFYLQKTILNNEIELVFDQLAIDSNGRVLSYIHKNNVDIGEDMVSSGLTLVYTKYSFSRITKYLKSQRSAYESKTGIWNNPKLAKRSENLLKLWEQERK